MSQNQIQVPISANQAVLVNSIQSAVNKASKTATLNVHLDPKAINKFSQPLGRITGQADEFTKSMNAANARVFAFGASVGVINALSRAFSGLISNTIKVEKSLTEIGAVWNKTTSQMEEFSDKMFSAAKITAQSFDVVSESALELARQGLEPVDTLKRLTDALVLARQSGLSAKDSVEGLTAAFNSFQSSGLTTYQIVNKLVAVSQKYSVSERDLIEAIKRSASVADQAGVSFDELVGMVTAVQQKTARGGAVIGNALKTIFSRSQDTQTLKSLQDLGIQVTDLSGKILPASKLLENLGSKFNSLSEIEQLDISKKLAGTYQLDKFLALMKDISSASAVTSKAVQTSMSAANEAYEKNEAQNQALFAVINKVTLSAQQLGATLGKIGLTSKLKDYLNAFNSFLEKIQELSGKDLFGDSFNAIKGIGAIITGPGLALFGAVVAKLTKDLVGFGVESLKTFFNFSKTAKEVQSLESSLVSTLSSNVKVQEQLVALGNDRVAQAKLLSALILEQEMAIRKTAETAKALAPILFNSGARVRGDNLRNPTAPSAAGGFMPAVASESAAIKKGVGGAHAGAKPVIIPNFAFGGGKRGTMVANTSEYIVPNFANGGSAIFNKNMVASMGLPKGAKKIAAGGFIPNFAQSIGGYTVYNYNDKLDREALKVLGIDVSSVVRSVAPQAITAQNKASLGLQRLREGSSVAFTVGNSKIIVPASQLSILQSSQRSMSEIKAASLSNRASKAAGFSSTTSVPRNADIELDANSFGGIGILALSGLSKSGSVVVPAEEVRANLFSRIGKKGVFDNLVKKEYRKTDAGLPPIFDRAGITKDMLPKGSSFVDSTGKTRNYVFNNSALKELESGTKVGPQVRLSNLKTFNPSPIQNTAEFSTEVNKTLAASLVALAQKMYGKLGFGNSAEATKALQGIAGSRAGGILSPAAEGSIFESIAKIAFSSFSNYGSAFQESENRPFDFKGSILEKMKKSIGANAPQVAFVDAKRTSDDSALRSIFKKLINDPETSPLAVSKITKGYIDFYNQYGTAASGYVPNFANPLYEAIGREISAGVPKNKIYVDQSPSLRSPANPMGLMVANTRDEPLGGSQGINRARSEGRNPMMYGAAKGFVPNFADLSDWKETKRLKLPKETVDELQADLKRVKDGMMGLSEILDKYQQIVSKAKGSTTLLGELIDQAINTKAAAIAKTKGYVGPPTVIGSRFQPDLKTQRLPDYKFAKAVRTAREERLAKESALAIETEDKERFIVNSPLKNTNLTEPNSKPPKDLLGMLFGVQIALSGFSGATEDATSSVVKWSNTISDIVNRGVMVKFAAEAFKGVAKEGSALSGVLGKLGTYGAIAAVAWEGWKVIASELDKTNSSIKEASFSMERVAESAKKAAVNLSTLSESQKQSISQKAEDLISGATIFSSVPVSQSQITPSGPVGGQTHTARFESDDLRTKFSKTIEEGLAAGIAYDKMWNMVREAAQSGGHVTSKEVDKISQEINRMIEEISKADSIIKKFDLSPEKGLGKFLANTDSNSLENVLAGNVKNPKGRKSALQLQIESFRGYLSSQGISEKITQDERIREEISKLKGSKEKKIQDDAERVQSINLDIAKSILKTEIELAVARSKNLDVLDKQKIQSEILNNLSEKQIRNLDYSISLRDEERSTSEKVLNLLLKQVEGVKGVVANSEEVEKIKQRISSLSSTELRDESIIKSIYDEILGLAQENQEVSEAIAKSRDQELASLFKIEQSNKDNLKSLFDQKEFWTAIADKTAVAAANINNLGSTKLFNQDISADKAIQANSLLIQQLEESKNGKSNAEIRTIEKEIARLNLENAAQENLKRNTDLLRQGREQFINAVPKSFGNSEQIAELANQSGSIQDLIDKLNSLNVPDISGNDQSAILNTIRSLQELSQTTEFQNKTALENAQISAQFAGIKAKELDVTRLMANYLEDIPQKLQDLELEKLTTASEKRLREIAYEQETLMKQAANPSGAAQIAKDRYFKPLSTMFGDAFAQNEAEQWNNLNEMLVNSSLQFRDNIIDGMNEAIEKGGSLGDVLQAAALEFARSMTKTGFTNVTNAFVGALGFAKGGQITGGSGNKDDVPAMLMGGEYVINKKSAKKYGNAFLDAVNNGTLQGYAKGGTVQMSPRKNYFTPGSFGKGSILGGQSLLEFATQGYTFGKNDRIVSRNNFASVALEPESVNLTNFGRRNGPAAEALMDVKNQAFGMYVEDYNKKKQYEDLKKQERRALINQWVMAVASVAAGAVASSASAGFKNAMATSTNTGYARFADGLKGVWSGANVSGQSLGGLSNLFSGTGFTTIQKAKIIEQLGVSASSPQQSGATPSAGSYRATAYGYASIDPTTAMDQRMADSGDPRYRGFSQYYGASGRKLIPGYSVASNKFPLGSILSINGQQFRVDDTGGMSNNVIDFFAGGDRSLYNQFAGWGSNLNVYKLRATGGKIDSKSGIDNVKAMLSGGEFVMNSSAAKNIGAGNLQALNAGAKSIATDEKSEELNEKLISKLDELIKVSAKSNGNISISVESGKVSESSSGNPSEAKQQLARQIKDAVIKIIQDEKRLGGQLRR